MLNTEFEREYIFNVDAYLIEYYPQMSLTQRRAICTQMYDFFDEEVMHEFVDQMVVDYALNKLELNKKEEELEE